MVKVKDIIDVLSAVITINKSTRCYENAEKEAFNYQLRMLHLNQVLENEQLIS